MSLTDKLEVSLLAAAVDDLLPRLDETLTDREGNVRTLKSYTAIDAVRSSHGSFRSRPSVGGLPGAVVVGVDLGDELDSEPRVRVLVPRMSRGSSVTPGTSLMPRECRVSSTRSNST